MSEIADFLRRQSEQQQASAIGAAQVVLGSIETKPDEVAADLNLADTFSKTTGNPAPPLPMVSEYRGVFAQAVERAQNNTILSKAPVLSDWLRDPKNAALAKDTLPELSWWESGWQASTGAVSRGVMRLPQSYNQWLAQGAAQRAGDQSLGFGALLSDEMAIRDQSGQIIQQAMAIPGPDDVWNASMRFLTSRLSGAVGSDQQQQAQFYQQQAGEIAKRIAAIPMSEGGERFKQVFGTLGKSGDVMADLGQFATSVAADPAGFLSFITETAVESAPSIAAATAATVVTRNPVAGATVLGTYSGAIEMGTAPVEFFQEKGIDVSTPEGAMRVISDPALMREAANRGVIRGLIIGAMDGLSGGIAGKALASSPLGNVALQAVTQAAMGAAGEAGAQIASGQQFNIAEVILEGLAEFVTAPIEVAGVGGRVFVDGQRKAADAEARKVMFEQLSGQASSSVLRTRMPAAFQDFVARATANGPVENVYVPADQFVTYFQGIGVDPNEIVSELGLSRDDLDVALAGGGDLQIPTSVYAAKIAGSEHDAFLMENMRFDPDEFTSAEAAEFNAKAQDAMQEAWEVAENLRIEQEELRTFEQEIYDTMVSRLRTAGRSTDVATTEALLYPAFYRVMAERSNMAVDEFMARYPLPQVQGSLPEGMQFRDVDALNRTLAEARARKTAGLAKRGPSLLEFISDRGGMIDPGGELRARDAETIRRGKGKKTLRLARGGVLTGMADLLNGNSGGAKYGVDAVAQAAIEAGYLANDPVVMEYQNALREGREVPDITRALWDAIDRELRGEGEYVSNAQADAADEQTAALDQIEAYLNEIGVSLDADDAAIKAAIEADQAGRQYAQGGDPIVAYEAAKANLDAAREAFLAMDRKAKFGKDGEAEKYFELSGAMSDAKDELAQAVANLPGAVVLRHWSNEKRGAVLTRSMDQGAEWRVTYFDERGFSGDAPRKDRLTAAKEMVNDGFEVIAPNMLREFSKLPSFVEGNEVTERIRQMNAESARRSYNQSAPTLLQSDAFKRWFGDSKVVDEAGNPLVVYHGTTADFEAFKPNVRKGEQLGFGIHFAVDSDFAARYASDPEVARKGKNSRVVSAYLSIKNPLKADQLVREGSPEFALAKKLAGSKLYTSKDENGIPSAWMQNAIDYTSPARAEKLIRDAGFDGMEYEAKVGSLAVGGRGMSVTGKSRSYIVFEPTQIKSVNNTGTFDPADPRILFQRERGSIQFPAGGVGNGDTIIRLFENADLSTTVHESGHYFLTVTRDLAARGEASAQEAMTALQTWWGENAAAVAKDGMKAMPDVTVTADDVRMAVTAGTTGDVMKDAAIDVGMQEQFARGFEAYLMEGKAPSAELRGAFEKFRAWLISIYQRLAGLNVNLSPGVREVFDRMLASDAEIAKAKAESGDTGPVFATAETMGLTPEEYAAFLKLRSQGEDDAKARLMREAMAPVKRAQEKWFKEERAKVRTEVERNINASPVFRAMEWMGNRRWLGDGKPEEMPDIRLSKDILVERYGEGVLKTLPRGKQTVYAVEGGIDPDDAAGWFGFDSGDQMIRSMERAPNRKEAIEAETDKTMRDRHGDVLNDGRIEAEALDAVHTDKRGQWLAAELKAINEVAGLDVGLTAKEARETARQTIARMQVRDAMNANRFLSAERKAGEQAARLGAILAREGIWMQNARRRIATKARDVIREDGTADAVAGQIDQANRSTGNYNETVAAVAEAKRRQLLNHALYMEARKVADEVEKAERFVAKLGKATHREKIAGAGRRENAQVDYLGAIDDLLERYDFRKSSGTADQRRGALAAFIETIKAQGRENELAIPEAVLADAARRPYKTLPVEELRGVVDSLKNLEHMALRWDKLIDAQQQRELEAVVDDITAAFDANLPKRPPGRVRGVGEGARNITRQFFDLVLNATTLLREIDGFKDGGAAYRNIKSPIDEAMSRLIGRKEKAAADLEGLYSVYTDEERRDMAVRKHMPELGYALSKWERIAVALNTGNAGNYQRLTDKRVRGALNDAQVAAVLASLDERDAVFVQSVWDYVGSFRTDIAARERRTTGVEPAWVDPSPVVIAGKTLRGGYYPLKYDPRLSSLARDDQANEIAQSLQAGRFGKAQTRNGHTKERAQSSGRDIELDMSVLHRHVNQVIYDLELSEPVANSWRVLQNARVRSAFIDAGKQADFDALEIWLKDVAEGELKSADLVGRAARTLKSNFTAAKLALNLGTVMMQVTGIAQSAVVVGKKNMAIGVQQSFRAGIGDEIAAKSDFMRTRQTTFNKDIFDFYNDPLTGPALSKWGDFKQKWVGPLSFWLMTKVQWYAADIPTWLAGYNQGLAKFGNDEAKAIAHADSIVKRAQASGLFSDRSAVERGSVSRNARQNDVVRLFTALGSYMFAKFNVAYERSAVAGRTIAQEGVSVKSAQEALSWTVDMAFLFTLEAVLMEVIKGFLTGLGKDDDDEKKDKNWAEFIAKQTALGVMGTIPFVRDLAGPLQGFSGGGAYGAITGELTRPMQQIMQGEVDAALVKSVISATGVATGLPATQINRAVDAAWRQVEGENVAPLEYLLGKSRN